MNISDVKPNNAVEILLDIGLIQTTHYSDTATNWLKKGAVLLAVGNTGKDEEGRIRPIYALGWQRSKGTAPAGMEDGNIPI